MSDCVLLPRYAITFHKKNTSYKLMTMTRSRKHLGRGLLLDVLICVALDIRFHYQQ